MTTPLHHFGRWFETNPHRFTIANIFLLTLLLAIMNSKALFMTIGGIAIVIAGLHCVGNALGLTIKNWKSIHPFQIALIWAPGAIALLLSSGGVYLATHQEPGTLFSIAGSILFGFEVAMLVILGQELRGSENSITQYLEVK